MNYRELRDALSAIIDKNPERGEETAYIAAKKRNGLEYFDTDCVAVEVRLDPCGLIILTEGDQ